MDHSDGSGIKSAERALTILELFSRLDKPLTFTEVAAKLGYPRSSLHGLLRTLTGRGWLSLDPVTRRFSLGLRAWEAGHAYRPAADLARSAAPVVERLEADFDGRVHVAVLDGGDTVWVAGSPDGVGRRVAAPGTGAGKVLLAELDRGERSSRLGSAVETLHGTLDEVRAQGWGADDEDQAAGLRVVAVPVRDRSGGVVAALGLEAPSALVSSDDAVRALRSAAAQISTGLGYSAVSAG